MNPMKHERAGRRLASSSRGVVFAMALFLTALMMVGAVSAADDHEGETALGSATNSGITIAAKLFGDVAPGENVHLDIEVESGGGTIEVLRVWVGLERGRSRKAKAENADDSHTAYHADVEVPKPLPEGSAIWFQAQLSESRLSLSLPIPGAKASGHDKDHGHETDSDHADHDHGRDSDHDDHDHGKADDKGSDHDDQGQGKDDYDDHARDEKRHGHAH